MTWPVCKRETRIAEKLKRLPEWERRKKEEIGARMAELRLLSKAPQEELERCAREGEAKYGPFAPYPCRMSPKDGKFRKVENLPRIAGVGEVDRQERLEALNRLALHCSGEEPILEFGELDRCARVLLQIPRAHAVVFHRNIVEALDNWIKYMPCGRGTVGAQRKAYMKARQFISVLKP